MSDHKDRGQNPQDPEGRRFRLTRKVKPSPPPPADPPTWSEREQKELATLGDDADRGTPEQDASLRAGCSSFVKVIMLFFVVMIGSIIATCAFKG